MSAKDLRNIASYLWKVSKKYTKAEYTTRLCTLFRKTYEIEKLHSDVVIMLQRRWRNRHPFVYRGQWSITRQAVNDDDVYTMEPLDSFPSHHIFSYKDTSGAVYAFYAPELYYDVQTNGAKNPYTRETIPLVDVRRLERMMATIPKKHVPNPGEEAWNSVDTAYGHVLNILGREYGIHCNTEWMLQWTKRHITRIFYEFHQNCGINTDHFNLDSLGGNSIQCKYALAKEIYRLLSDRDHQYNMYMVCNMLLAFANNSSNFRRYLPQWVLLGAATDII